MPLLTGQNVGKVGNVGNGFPNFHPILPKGFLTGESSGLPGVPNRVRECVVLKADLLTLF